jgi:hypothetical protein
VLRNTFDEVIRMTRAEARLSSNTSRGIDQLETIKQIITRIYIMLCEDFEWSHLKIKRDDGVSRKNLEAGSRYYDYPAAINPLKVEEAWCLWANRWTKMDFGIDYSNYNVFSPERDMRTSPATCWYPYGDSQFEVWPLPSQDHSEAAPFQIAFVGQKAVEQLVDGGNRLDMDDFLVSLMAAAEILGGMGSEQSVLAKQKADAANRRMAQVRRGQGFRGRSTIGRGMISNDARGYPRSINYVGYRRST